jgi:DivIVA domain-containing protein
MRQPGFDIRNHAFTHTLRGYDETEVASALDAVTPAYEEAYAALGEAEQALAEAVAERDRLLQGEKSMIRLIRSAEEHARMHLGSAHREAARIVAAAEEEARLRVAGAEEQRLAVEGELAAVALRRSEVLARVTELVEAAATRAAAHGIARTSIVGAPDVVSPAGMASPVVTGHAALPAWTEDDLAQLSTSLPDTSGSDAPGEAVDALAAFDPSEGDISSPVEKRKQWTPRRLLADMTLPRAAGAAAVVLSVAAIASPAVRNWGATPVQTHTTVLSSPPAATPDAVEPVAPSDVPTSSGPAVTAPIAIKLTSSRPCWVRVTADGKAENVLLDAGNELERTASTRVDLRIGDAGAATVELNGRTLPALGRDGQVINRTFTLGDLRR